MSLEWDFTVMYSMVELQSKKTSYIGESQSLLTDDVQYWQYYQSCSNLTGMQLSVQ